MMADEQAQILVVDDDDAGRYVKAHLLRRAGHAVIEAASGHDAIERVTAGVPDLILLDVNLPDISGIDVCRRVKEAYPFVVILQTSAAHTEAADRTRALDGGADSYLIEPIEPTELDATVRALLRMRKAERDLRHLNETLESQVADRTRELAEVNGRLEAEMADRRQAEEMLWHTQRLEVIGRIAGGVAHDFNNLLAVISGNQELIRDALERPGPLHRDRLLRYLSTADRAAARGAQITGQLLAFSRRSVLRHESVDVNALITGFESFLRRALGESVSLDLNFAPSLWSCQIDPIQFEAAILNLIVNARDAMEEGGRASVETGNVTFARAGQGKLDGLDPGSYVHIRVTDSGVGMTEDVMARAFEPFFTTKDIGSGSGLGLSQVYGFVKQSGGHVTIESEPGRGTVFSIYLPRADAQAKPIAGANALPEDRVPTGSETVLVVEDNEDVRNVVVTTISDLGYRVLIAANGAQALALIDSDAKIDLLFSDVVMPGGINGFDLARQAMGRRRQLRAVFTSGYAQTDGGGVNADYPLIMKPYRRAELAQKIRLALDGTRIAENAV
jgi:signal transduction histidine kinase